METKNPVFCNSCKHAKWVVCKGYSGGGGYMYDALHCTKRSYVSKEAYNTPIEKVDAIFDNLCYALNEYNDCNEYARGEPQKFFCNMCHVFSFLLNCALILCLFLIFFSLFLYASF